MIFSIHSVHWIEMKQIESEDLRARNTGCAGKVNIWIFYLYSHGNSYLPAHIHKHKHTAVLHTVENTLRRRLKTQTQLLNEYKLTFSLSSCGGLVCVQVQMSPSRNPPPLVLIHICGRCHSMFPSASQGFPFLFLFSSFSFVRIISKILSFHDSLETGALLKSTRAV